MNAYYDGWGGKSYQGLCMWTYCQYSQKNIQLTFVKNGNQINMDCGKAQKGKAKELEDGSNVWVYCPDYDLICDDKWGSCVYGYEISPKDFQNNCACRPGHNTLLFLSF